MGIQDAVTAEPAVWLFDLARGGGGAQLVGGSMPFWRPDGEEFAYAGLGGEVKARQVDGSDAPELLYRPEYFTWPTSWSPDGRWLAVTEFRPDTGADALAVSTDDPQERIGIASTIRFEGFPMFSPDGKWVDHTAIRNGLEDVYVKGFPEGGSYKISNSGGTRPIWNRKGDAIYYTLGNKVMFVEVDTADGFSSSLPRELFEGPYRAFNFDVSPDGQTLVMVAYDPSVRPRVHLVQNWFEELKRLAPTDN